MMIRFRFRSPVHNPAMSSSSIKIWTIFLALQIFSKQVVLSSVDCSKLVHEGNIKIPALGRVEGLGSMFDLRQNSFTGKNVFNLVNHIPAIPSVYSRRMQTNTTITNVDIVDSLMDTIRLLEIDPDLAISLLTGQVSIDMGGSSLVNFLTRCNRIHNECPSSQVVLTRQIRTIQEKLQPTDDGLLEHYNESVLEFELNVTHVVVGITWGGNFIFSSGSGSGSGSGHKKADEDLTDSESETEIDSTVENINEIFKLIKNHPNSYSLTKNGTTNKIKLNMEIFSDVTIPPTTIQTLADLSHVLETVLNPSDVFTGINNGKGIPIYYELMPISEMKRCLSREFPFLNYRTRLNIEQVNEQSITNLIEIFNWISIVQQKTFNLSKKIQTYKVCLPDDEQNFVQNVQTEFLENVINFKAQVSNALFLVRSGKRNQSLLQNLLSDYKDHNALSVYHINQKVDIARNRVFEKIQLYQKFRKHGVQYIGRDSFLQNEILNYHSSETVYVLFIKNNFKIFNVTSWLTNVTFFFEATSKNNSAMGIVVDCDFTVNIQCEEISRINHTVIRKLHSGMRDFIQVDFSELQNGNSGSKLYEIVQNSLNSNNNCPCSTLTNENVENKVTMPLENVQDTTTPIPSQIIDVENESENEITNSAQLIASSNTSCQSGTNAEDQNEDCAASSSAVKKPLLSVLQITFLIAAFGLHPLNIFNEALIHC